MAAIFVNYRRNDAQGWAGHLRDAIATAFGDRVPFVDIYSIPPGDDFARTIEQAIEQADVVLVLIGPRWLAATSRDGRRRLDDPGDLVRIEIAAALKAGARVIPVLLGGVACPPAEDLPADLAELADRNAFELSDSRWDHDCGRLFDAIEEATGLPRVRRRTGEIVVAKDLVIENSTVRDIAGTKGSSDGVPDAANLDIASGARIRSSTIRDIVGSKSTGRGSRPR